MLHIFLLDFEISLGLLTEKTFLDYLELDKWLEEEAAALECVYYIISYHMYLVSHPLSRDGLILNTIIQ